MIEQDEGSILLLREAPEAGGLTSCGGIPEKGANSKTAVCVTGKVKKKGRCYGHPGSSNWGALQRSTHGCQDGPMKSGKGTFPQSWEWGEQRPRVTLGIYKKEFKGCRNLW